MKLEQARNSLEKQKTTAARRRFSPEADGRQLIQFVDPFLFDSEFGIVLSKAHHRQVGKSQVITEPDNPHVRTRITHTGEVVCVAAAISSILGLNVQLTVAIALGHDIGHLPLGHPGERALRKIASHPVRHEVFGVVIAQHIERNGRGLNLTHQVLSGMWQHSLGKENLEMANGMTPESAVVAISDKIAYTIGDYEDAVRVNLPLSDELTKRMAQLGNTSEERRERLIESACLESAEVGHPCFHKSEFGKILREVRSLMYEGVYPRMDLDNSEGIVEKVFSFVQRVVGPDIDPVMAYALLTDREVISMAAKPVCDVSSLMHTGMWELLRVLRGKEIKWWELDLDW